MMQTIKIPAKNVKSDITYMCVEGELEGNNPLFSWWLILDGRIQVIFLLFMLPFISKLFRKNIYYFYIGK